MVAEGHHRFVEGRARTERVGVAIWIGGFAEEG